MRIKDVTAESKFYLDEKGQWRYRYGGKDRTNIKAVTGICSGCGEPYVVVGQPSNAFCSRSCAGRKGGDGYHGIGAEGRHWKGGRVIGRGGYVHRYAKGHPTLAGTQRKYVLEHRLVMEEKLGRRLLRNEEVHHINGVKDDNRPENLELWIKSQPSGVRLSDYHCPGCRCEAT